MTRFSRALVRRALPEVALVLLAAVTLAAAPPVTYTVTVNTTSLAGTTGSLDFNFNPGPFAAQSATVQILSLAGGTPIGSPTRIGDASGSLPATVALDNGTGFNDYFQAYKFGSTLTFQVTLSGPAITAPDGISTSGTTFAFSIFSDAAGTIPALTTDAVNGFAVVINVNLDGSTTVTNTSLQTNVSAASQSTASAVPALSPMALGALALSLAGLGVAASRRRTAISSRSLPWLVLLILSLGFSVPLSAQSRSAAEPRLLDRTEVTVTSSGLTYSRVTGSFRGTVTVTNAGRNPIEGPLHVVIAPSGSGEGKERAAQPGAVALRNAAGSYHGSPYITAGSRLAPGQSVTVVVVFGSNQPARFRPLVYAGSIQ